MWAASEVQTTLAVLNLENEANCEGKKKKMEGGKKEEEMHGCVSGEVRFMSALFFFFFPEGQFWDSLQILSELCRCLTLFHPLSFTVPCSCPLETRWRDDREVASVKTANQYGSSVRDEAPRLHWKSQMANDSFKLLSPLWTFRSGAKPGK